jgi:hypothetical protein
VANPRNQKVTSELAVKVSGLRDVQELTNTIAAMGGELKATAELMADAERAQSSLAQSFKKFNDAQQAAGSPLRLKPPKKVDIKHHVPVVPNSIFDPHADPAQVAREVAARTKAGHGVELTQSVEARSPKALAAELANKHALHEARSRLSDSYSPTTQALMSLMPAGSAGQQSIYDLKSFLRSNDPYKQEIAKTRLQAITKNAPAISVLADTGRMSSQMLRFAAKAMKQLQRGEIPAGLETAQQGLQAQAQHSREQSFDTTKIVLYNQVESLRIEVDRESSEGSIDSAKAASLFSKLNDANAALGNNDFPSARTILAEVKGELEKVRHKTGKGAVAGRTARAARGFEKSLSKLEDSINQLDPSLTGRTGAAPADVASMQAELQAIRSMPSGTPAERQARATAKSSLEADIQKQQTAAGYSATLSRRQGTSSVNRGKITQLRGRIQRLAKDGYLDSATVASLLSDLTRASTSGDANVTNAILQDVNARLTDAEDNKKAERQDSGGVIYNSKLYTAINDARKRADRLEARYGASSAITTNVADLRARASDLETALTTGAHDPELQEKEKALGMQLQATNDSAAETKKLSEELAKHTKALIDLFGVAPREVGDIHDKINTGDFVEAIKKLGALKGQVDSDEQTLDTATKQARDNLTEQKRQGQELAMQDLRDSLEEKYGRSDPRVNKFYGLYADFQRTQDEAEALPEGSKVRAVKQLEADAAMQQLRNEEALDKREQARVRSGAQYRLGMTRGIIRAETALGNAAAQVVAQDVRGLANLPIQAGSAGSGFLRDMAQNSIISKGASGGNVAAFVAGLVGDATFRVLGAGAQRGAAVLERSAQSRATPLEAFEALAAQDPGVVEQGLVNPKTGKALTPFQLATFGRDHKAGVPYIDALNKSLELTEDDAPSSVNEEKLATSIERKRVALAEAEAFEDSWWPEAGGAILGGAAAAFLTGGAAIPILIGAAVTGAAAGGAADMSVSNAKDKLAEDEALAAYAKAKRTGKSSDAMSPEARAELSRRNIEMITKDLFGSGKGNVTRAQLANALNSAPIALGGAFANEDPEGIMSRMTPEMRAEVMSRHAEGVKSGAYSNDASGIMQAVDTVVPRQYRFAGAAAELANKYGMDVKTLGRLDALGPSFGISNKGLRTLPGMFGEGGFGFKQGARNAYLERVAGSLEEAGMAGMAPDLASRSSYFAAVKEAGGNSARLAQGYVSSITAMQGVLGQVVAPAQDVGEQLLMAKALSEYGDIEEAMEAVQQERPGYTVRDKDKMALENLGRTGFGLYKKGQGYSTKDIDAMVETLKSGKEGDVEDIYSQEFTSRKRAESQARRKAEALADETAAGADRTSGSEADLAEIAQTFDEATVRFYEAVEKFATGALKN